MLKTRNKQIYEEASEWLVLLRVGDMDASSRERLDAWFRESPHHIRAFLELSSIWEDVGDPDIQRNQSTDALIARARANTNIIALNGEGSAARQGHEDTNHLARRSSDQGALTSSNLRRFFSRRSVAVVSTIVGCLAVGLVVWNDYRNPSYTTGTGEQRIVHLSDGSTLELNSGSHVRVFFSERERDVELIEGQALFKVAKDLSRPFVVRSDKMRVRAVGTQFDVYRQSSGTTVTVLEGRVAVFSSAQKSATPLSQGQSDSQIRQLGSSPVLVSVGEQVVVTARAVSPLRRADLKTATAWTTGELVFDMRPLPEVAREFNRYNTRKIIVSDPRLDDFHVTGVFSSTDPASLLRFLRGQPGIEVVEADTEIHISSR